jgi:hypothetical protein
MLKVVSFVDMPHFQGGDGFPAAATAWMPSSG